MVTVKDIAKASGVSPSTVSIILNGKSEERKISEKTCEKVWNTVRQLGYQPNIAARTLRERGENDIRTIALYWANDFRTFMLSRFLKGLESAASPDAPPYEIVVFTYSNGQLARQSALLSGKRFHAAIIANASEKDMEFIQKAVFPVPVALYNRFIPDHYCVTVDNYKMGQLAANAVLLRNKCRPWILTTDPFPGMELRIQGFCDTLAVRNIAVAREHILCAQNTMASGNETTQKLLHRVSGKGFDNSLCDSIFCLSDAVAHGALFTLNRAGIDIPGQISVISIGNGEASHNQYAIPPLSNVYLPMEDMARTCLDILLELLEHKAPIQKNIVLDTPLRMLES